MKELDCLKAKTGIAKDIYNDGKISFETTDHLCGVLKDMKKVMEMYQVAEYQVYIGTTVQQAQNDLFVLEQMRCQPSDYIVCSRKNQNNPAYYDGSGYSGRKHAQTFSDVQL